MKRLTIVSLVALTAFLLSACATGTSGSSWPGLAADQNTVYLADASFVYAVRVADGVKVWQYPDKAGKEQFYSNPVLTADGALLVGSSGPDYALISLDAASGKPKWGVPFTASDHWVASPLVLGDTVYAPNNNGTLYAVKLATGQLAWSLPITNRSLWGAPATDGKLVFVTSLDHFLYAVDPATQKVAWKVDLGGSVPGSPAVASDGSAIYVGSFARKLFSVNPASGAVAWTTSLNDWVWGTPAPIGDALYVADISGNLYSLAKADGKNAWPQLKPNEAITGSPLALPNGVAVVTESGFVYGFKPDGSSLWPPVSIGGKIYTSPLLVGDRIVVAPMGAQYWLYAVNSKDGSILPWHFDNK